MADDISLELPTCKIGKEFTSIFDSEIVNNSILSVVSIINLCDYAINLTVTSY